MSSSSSQSAGVLRQDFGASNVGTLSGQTVQERLEAVDQMLLNFGVVDESINGQISTLSQTLESSVNALNGNIDQKKSEAIDDSQNYTDQKIALLSGESGSGQASDQSVFISMIKMQADSELNQFNLREKLNEVK